jgi:hypothetical protein
MKTNQTEIQQEALARAMGGLSMANYVPIFEGFMGKGIPEADIRPRENVFTYQAWRALGRQVRKGEHGVRVCTFAPVSKEIKNETTGEMETRTWRRPWYSTVFHVTQTDPMQEVA